MCIKRLIKRLSNERGFTLLESLFQMMVFILFSSISLLILIWFRDLYNLEKMKDDVNWEVFVYDLNQYNERALAMNVGSVTHLEIDIWEEDDEEPRKLIISKSEKHLKKSVFTQGGNEILLPFVSSWDLYVENNEVNMKVVMKDGTIRQRKMVLLP